MSDPQLSERYVEYVLDEFDAFNTPHQILHALHSEGHVGMQINAILECLQQYGRIPHHDAPTNVAISQSAQSVAPANTSQAQNLNTNQTLSTQNRAEQAHTLRWNTHADALSLAAYREGYGVRQIKAQLRSHGYRANLAEVATSLRSLGERDLRMWGNKSPERFAPANISVERTCGNPTRPPVGKAPALCRDAWADRFSLAANSAEQGVWQIKGQQRDHVYSGPLTQATTSLRRQGERHSRSRGRNDPLFRWNFQTPKKSLALDAHRIVKTVVRLSPLLFRQDRSARLSDLQIYTILKSTYLGDAGMTP
ncbi:hypothetical protein MMC31_004677 [Peltigera leucophlebia]|nr:hypothetical protein [Peltigera leucophlebia]